MTQDDGRNPVGDVFEALGTAIDERIERMRRPFFGPEDEPGFFEWLTTEAIPSLARTFDFASPTLEVTQIVLLAADHLDRIGKGEAATAVREGREPSWEALIDPTDLSGDPTTRRAIQSELVPGDQAQRHPVAFRELAQLEAIAAKIAALPEGHPDRATLLREHQVSLQLARGGHVTIRDDNGRPIPLLDHLATIESAVDAAALDRAGEVPFQQVHYFDTVDQQQVRLLTRTRTEGGGAVTEVSLSGADWQIRDDQRYRPLDEDPSLDPDAAIPAALRLGRARGPVHDGDPPGRDDRRRRGRAMG